MASRFFGHLKTVITHRRAVRKLCRKAGIPWAGLRHDLSKYSPTEFSAGVRYYAGGVKSPNENERAALGYSRAWLHHKGRNRHHFEYWTDYNPAEHRVMPIEMPLRYVAELICDRVAASKTYQKENYTDAYPLAYFDRGRQNRVIHPATSALIEEMLTLLAEQGEDAAFAELRRRLRAEKQRKKTPPRSI